MKIETEDDCRDFFIGRYRAQFVRDEISLEELEERIEEVLNTHYEVGGFSFKVVRNGEVNGT